MKLSDAALGDVPDDGGDLEGGDSAFEDAATEALGHMQKGKMSEAVAALKSAIDIRISDAGKEPDEDDAEESDEGY